MPVQVQVEIARYLGAQTDAGREGVLLDLRVEVEVEDRVDRVRGTDRGGPEVVAGDKASGQQRRVRDDQADAAMNPNDHVDQRQGGDLPGAGTGDVRGDQDQHGSLERVIGTAVLAGAPVPFGVEGVAAAGHRVAPIVTTVGTTVNASLVIFTHLPFWYWCSPAPSAGSSGPCP